MCVRIHVQFVERVELLDFLSIYKHKFHKSHSVGLKIHIFARKIVWPTRYLEIDADLLKS